MDGPGKDPTPLAAWPLTFNDGGSRVRAVARAWAALAKKTDSSKALRLVGKREE